MDRLSAPDDLDQLTRLTSPRSWLLLGALGGVLAAVGLWSVFGTIPLTVSGKGLLESNSLPMHQLHGVLYLPFDEAAHVQPGMSVHLAPLAGYDQQPAEVVAYVDTVGTLPATYHQMLQRLGNEAYVGLLAEQGALIEVRFSVNPDQQHMPAHLAESASQALPVQAGQPINGTVTLARQKPLSFMFPTK